MRGALASHEEPNSSDHCAYFSREATVGLTLPGQGEGEGEGEG